MQSFDIATHVQDVPQLRRLMLAANDDTNLRLDATTRELLSTMCELLRVWAQRVSCPQCGDGYEDAACGPTHALIWRLVTGPNAADNEV